MNNHEKRGLVAVAVATGLMLSSEAKRNRVVANKVGGFLKQCKSLRDKIDYNSKVKSFIDSRITTLIIVLDMYLKEKEFNYNLLALYVIYYYFCEGRTTSELFDYYKDKKRIHGLISALDIDDKQKQEISAIARKFVSENLQ